MADGKVTIETEIDQAGIKSGISSIESSFSSLSKSDLFKSSALSGVIASLTSTITTAAGQWASSMASSAFDGYASYEQLVGGVEKLFGEASGVVEQYAGEAYSTVGMTANDYMELASSTAASMISSLGGDVQTAAEYVNMSITDMQDNASIMGTDLERLEDAYRGFSRGEFTMLDNLKLGYGGTKEEMQRLLDKAEELSGFEYDISSYSDIVQAIHVVQTEMGITGNAQMELANTVEGSVSQMKAAWENWLANLMNSDADMGTLTDQLVATIENAATVIMPKIVQMAESLGQALPQLVSAILPYIPQVVEPLASGIMDALGQAIAADPALGVVAGLVTAFKGLSIVSSIAPMFTGLSGALTTVGTAGSLASAVMGGLSTALGLLTSPAGLVVVAIAAVVAAVVYLWNTNEGFRDAVLGVWQAIQDAVSAAVGGVVSFLASMLSAIGDAGTAYGNLLSAASSAMASMLSAVSSGVSGVVSFFAALPGNILSALGDLGGLLWNAGASIVSGLLSGLQSTIGSVYGFVSGIADTIASLKGPIPYDMRLLVPNGEAIMSGLQSGIDSGLDDVLADVSGIAGAVQGELAAAGGSIDWYATGGVHCSAAALGAGGTGAAALGAGSASASGGTAHGVDEKALQSAALLLTQWLDRNLGGIIAEYAPTATPREFARMVRASA